MKGIYQITKALNDALLSYDDINVVTVGSLEDIDLNKQTIMPLAHIEIGTANVVQASVEHTITIFFMDIVDVSNEDPREVEQYFWGNNNLHDVWHAMLATAMTLTESLRRGDLFDERIQLINASAEPFKERFTNLLAGWTLQLTISVPTSAYIC